MKRLGRLFKKSRVSTASSSDIEARFMRLYSQWHETHDLMLRRKMFLRLNILMRRAPDFDMRRWFKHAF
jgi:hypothetical protein